MVWDWARGVLYSGVWWCSWVYPANNQQVSTFHKDHTDKEAGLQKNKNSICLTVCVWGGGGGGRGSLLYFVFRQKFPLPLDAPFDCGIPWAFHSLSKHALREITSTSYSNRVLLN